MAIPSIARYKAALQTLADDMPPKHRQMLLANYRAPNHTISVKELARAVGYKSAFMQYGILAGRICKLLDFEPTLALMDGSPVKTHVIADSPPERSEDSWEWTLRPQVVEALERLGWVTKELPNTHLIVYDADAQERLLARVKKGKVDAWSATKRCNDKDLVFIYIGQPVQKIVAVAFVDGDWWTEEGPFDWTDREQATFCNYKPVWWLKNPIYLPGVADDATLTRWYRTKPYRGSRHIKPEFATPLLEMIVAKNAQLLSQLRRRGVNVTAEKARLRSAGKQSYEEGAVREITAELAYRDPKLREDAIRAKGCKCEICGFDFVEFYGGIGEGYIEVHHLRPLSKSKGRKVKTSLKNVAVVCANCHRMLHRHGAIPLSIHELRKMVKKRRRKSK